MSDWFLFFGSLFMFIAALGLVKMPDIFLRMHAATKAGTLGVCLFLFASVCYFMTWLVVIKMLLALIFIFFTIPVGYHLIARAAFKKNVYIYSKTKMLNRKSL